MITAVSDPRQPPTTAAAAAAAAPASTASPLALIRKGWREVRDSAGADLQLMRDRASTFRELATSIDRELENLDLVKRIQPKLSEFRRAYSSPDFSQSVLRRWTAADGGAGDGGGRILRLDLSAIRNAFASEVEDVARLAEWERGFRAWDWRGEREEWEPIRRLKSGLRQLERRRSSSSSDLLVSLKNSEFVEKLKTRLKSIYKEPEDSKDVPPLDVPELLAYLVKQSGPFLDQLGVRRDLCDKVVEALCSKRRDQLIWRSLSSNDTSVNENEQISDELDFRISSVLRSTGHCYEGGFWSDSGKYYSHSEKRRVAIVTTASLPWMTGTAVNPLFRAAYLAKSAKQKVTLLVPWLCKSDQELVYPNKITFSSPQEQEAYIRNWLEERVGFKADFKIAFYPGKFSNARRSIIPAGDTSQFISSKEADISILEEPEHLNWYHHGRRWTDKFNHVVGIVHTNYLEYIKREKNGALQAFLVKHINNWVTRAYCHKVLRLSAATQDLPKSTICNVHGVNPKFLEVGERVATERERGQLVFSKGAYFLGKMVWAKGYKELIDLMAKHKQDLEGFKLDVYGNGEDSQEVQSAAKKLELNVNFLKGRDHADDLLHSYKVFINPSVSDVLCTATAEALAMGKFVICADHPSNDFFRAFPNCLTYKTSDDFVARVKEVMSREPHPLTTQQRYNLSWEAATERFMEYSDLNKILNSASHPVQADSMKMMKSVSLPNLSELVDGGLAFAHYSLTGNEVLRLLTGAIPGTRDYDKQHSQDLHLLPPQVQNPVYGW